MCLQNSSQRTGICEGLVALFVCFIYLLMTGFAIGSKFIRLPNFYKYPCYKPFFFCHKNISENNFDI